MPTTKPFAIATEGPTIDGRLITRQQIEDMAKSYDPAVYTALVNLEHFISFSPDSSFSAYGKVLKLGTRETDILGEKRLQLTAVADVSEAAADLQYKGKKAFASCEIMPNFIGKGISYLTGLALTDSPASTGTESMRFSAFSDSKQRSRYTFAGETGFEIEPAANTDGGNGEGSENTGASLVARVKELLGITGKSTNNALRDHAEAMSVIASNQRENAESITRLASELSTLATSLKAAENKLGENAQTLASIKASLESTPTHPTRPPATGSAVGQTDC